MLKQCLLSAGVFLILAGCASDVSVRVNNEVEQSYQLLADYRTNIYSAADMAQLYGVFVKNDEAAGIWESSLLLSQALSPLEPEQSLFYANECLVAANRINSDKAAFDCHVQLYSLTGDEGHLRLAQRKAATEFQQNTYYFLSGNHNSISVSSEENYTPRQLAYTYYWMARSCECETNLDKAYDLFRQTANPRGIADTLFYWAKLKFANNDRQQAMDYAHRSKRILQEVGAEYELNQISNWLRTNGLDR